MENTTETPQISAQNKPKPTKQPSKYFTLGRPSKYKRSFCQAIVSYFEQELYFDRVKSVITQKNGSEIINYEQCPNPPIWFSDFAYSIGVATSTLREWKKLYPEFNSAYTRAKELQHQHINNLANMGLFNSQYAQFTMKNISEWRDKKDFELSGKVDAQVFFADLLLQADEALANERKVLGNMN